MDDYYAVFTIDGDQLEVEAMYSGDTDQPDKLSFYYEYANQMTDRGFVKLKEEENRGVLQERHYDEVFQGNPIRNTFKLKNANYHVVNIAKMKRNENGFYGGLFELYYDYFIEKKGDEYTFSVPKHYDANLDLMLTLDSPEKYAKLYIYNEADRLAVTDLSNQICKGASTDLEKIRKIHDWIIANIYYDKDGLKGRKSICYGSAEIIKTKMTVCEGFANLFRDLLNAQKIPCVNVSSYEHGWNVVYADGRWMYFDVTWNTHNEFINGEFKEDDTTYKYYDIDPFFFSYDHLFLWFD